MFLACKVEEIFAPEITDFVYITDDAYTSADIRRMELRILNSLNFDLCPPLSINFLRRFSKAGSVDILQHSVAKYILEQAMLDYCMVSVPPSLLAAAALYLSLLLTEDNEELWNPNLHHYSNYSKSQLLPMVRVLSMMVSKAGNNTKLQAVKNKYSGSRFLRVAELPQLQADQMNKLKM